MRGSTHVVAEHNRAVISARRANGCGKADRAGWQVRDQEAQ
jgi:hypothetical protein